jgi:hypothetical protein
MRYQITARYGHRYHLVSVEAEDAAAALRQGADLLPAELVPHIDLVELRVAVDPDHRPLDSGNPDGNP